MTEKITPHLDPASTLCTSCGLCCKGALHVRAILKPGEAGPALALGLPVEADGLAFTLPCPKLIDRKCSIYNSRPSVCAGYKCQLLLDFDVGKIGFERAMYTVARARAMLAELAADRAAPALTAAGSAVQTLRRTSVRLFIDKNFMNANDTKLVKQQIIAPAGVPGDN